MVDSLNTPHFHDFHGSTNATVVNRCAIFICILVLLPNVVFDISKFCLLLCLYDLFHMHAGSSIYDV